MPTSKQDTARYPRTYVFDTFSQPVFGPLTVAIAAAATTVQDSIPLPCSCKVVKVAVSWLTATLANLPSFNIVYNTVQNLGAAQTYTAGNVAPNDNSYTGGHSLDNAALKTLYPNFDQAGGMGVPTNVAVDGQPLFAADVALNTTNFPGAHATLGGQGVLVPTNWDAVYIAGPYAYGVGQNIPAFANLASCFTLRSASPTTTITGLKVTLFVTPIMTTQTVAGTAISSLPGVLF